MDAVLLARIQFAMTLGFHYIFPPLSIGLGWMLFIYNYRYLKTGDEQFKQLAHFWTKIFALTFAMGVATGITMEFQFGTNWAAYSRFVGDIFGAPLAAEGIFSFFLESTFLGILLYGKNKVSKKAYCVSSFLVAFGATLSAFWIVVANSWQQTPAGYEIVNGRAELIDFWAAVFNPSTLPRYSHVITGALTNGTFFVLGTSAWQVFKGRNVEFFTRSLKTAVWPSAIAILLTMAVGHWSGVEVSKTQPAKMAAFEGLWETCDNAPLLVFGIPNEEEECNEYAFEIPGLVSLMIGNSLDTEVKGLKDFPKEDRPPVLMTFLTFHLMLVLGVWFAFLALVSVVLWKLGKLAQYKLYLVATGITVPLPFLANQFGWAAAEIGRQPWVVYNEMRTKHAVSASVSAGEVLASIIMFACIYALLFGFWFYLMKKTFRNGPAALKGEMK